MALKGSEVVRLGSQEASPGALSKVVDRRKVLKGAASSGVAATGVFATDGLSGLSRLWLPPDARAAVSGNLAKEPGPIEAPGERYERVKDIGPVSLVLDEGLDDPKFKIPINGFVFSPYANEFEGLKPSYPEDRAKLIILKLCATLVPRMDEYVELPPGELDGSAYSDTSNPMVQRGQNIETPFFMEIADIAALIAENKKLLVPIWGYPENPASPYDLVLQWFDPRKGLVIRYLRYPGKNVFQGPRNAPATSSTHRVVDEQLEIGINVKDRDIWAQLGVTSGEYTPSKFQDLGVSRLFGRTTEELGFWAGRTDFKDTFAKGYDENVRQNDTDAFIVDKFGELSCGPKTEDDFTSFDKAPLLHTQSSKIDPTQR